MCIMVDNMEAQEIKGWNVFKQIFNDHWEGFKKVYPRYSEPYYEEQVKKMVSCGNPEEMGYIGYLCFGCGQGSRVVSMSCKSTLCLRCGKVYVDEWVSQVSEKLHEGVIYRHVVLTVPERLRIAFYTNGENLLGKLMVCGVKCMDDFFSQVSRKEIEGGYIVVLQTHGRNGHYNPHLHIIATSGGMDRKSGKWEHLEYLPYPMLHKKWQWYLLEMIRKEMDTEEVDRLVDDCYKSYPRGFVANVQKGAVPGRYESLARYLAKYVVSPPISIRRIDRYDGERVKYHYRSHKTEKVETEVVDVYTFIGRMIQHILPKGFKRIRYYGVQATKTYEVVKEIVRKALWRVKRIVNGAIKIIGRKSYRERYKESTGKDPFICPHCGKEMDVCMIWHPRYGVIYDEHEVIKRGKYEQREKEPNRDERNGGGAIRPTPKGVQLPLFHLWN